MQSLPLFSAILVAYLISHYLVYVEWWQSSEPAPRTSRRLHCRCRFLEPYDGIADQGCCCFLPRWRSWAILCSSGMSSTKFVQLKFEFLSFNTAHISDIWTTSCTRKVQIRLQHFLKGLHWVSVYGVIYYSLYSMSWMVSVFHFVPSGTICMHKR